MKSCSGRHKKTEIMLNSVTDIYTQKWNDALHETSKADSYKCYKSLLSPDKYLFVDLPVVFNPFPNDKF